LRGHKSLTSIYLSSLLPSRRVDDLLGGGFSTGEVVELFGVSGTGKTQVRGGRGRGLDPRATSPSRPHNLSPTFPSPQPQLCCAAAVVTALTRPDQGALYITTKPERLHARLYALAAATLRVRVDAILAPSSTTPQHPPPSSSSSSASSLAAALPAAAAAAAAALLKAGDGAEPAGGPASAVAVEERLRASPEEAIDVEARDVLRRIRVCRALTAREVLDALADTAAYMADPPGPEATMDAGPASDGVGDGTTSPPPQPGLLPVLLVLDGLHAVVAPLLGGPSSSWAGHGLMSEIGKRLHWLARVHHMAIVVTNTAVAERGGGGNAGKRARTGGAGLAEEWDAEASDLPAAAAGVISTRPALRPGLGPTWAAMPDVSLLLQRSGGEAGEGVPTPTPFLASVAKSTRLPATGGALRFAVPGHVAEAAYQR
jgi:hypothetical protein